MTEDFVTPFMEYLVRLDALRHKLCSSMVFVPRTIQHQAMVTTNAKFTEWAMKNQHLYQADKK